MALLCVTILCQNSKSLINNCTPTNLPLPIEDQAQTEEKKLTLAMYIGSGKETLHCLYRLVAICSFLRFFAEI